MSLVGPANGTPWRTACNGLAFPYPGQMRLRYAHGAPRHESITTMGSQPHGDRTMTASDLHAHLEELHYMIEEAQDGQLSLEMAFR